MTLSEIEKKVDSGDVGVFEIVEILAWFENESKERRRVLGKFETFVRKVYSAVSK